LNVLQRILKKITALPERYQENDFPSVVLLLRNAEFPPPEEMLRIARESWGTDGSVELLGTLRKKASYMFSCRTSKGAMMLSVHTRPQPYGGRGREPTDVLQRPWDEHQAWMSIDLPYGNNRKLAAERALADIYKAQLIFAFKVWAPNVLAVFFPGEGVTIPNFGDLAGCIQWAHRAGLDMSFLD
jgi:hypothetical protein